MNRVFRFNPHHKYIQGHTLIELMVAMSLSIIILILLVPLNSLSLKAINHQSQILNQIGKLRQAISLIEFDLNKAGLTGCLSESNFIIDSVFSQSGRDKSKFQQSVLAGFYNSRWFPKEPSINNNSIELSNDAISILFADPTTSLTKTLAFANPNRVVFITDCIGGEIIRARQSDILRTSSTQPLQIQPFQSVLYYLKKTNEDKTLYRQYLTHAGKPRNEPLVDNIEKIEFAYAEKHSDTLIKFKSADKIVNWENIIAVYLKISVLFNTTPHSIATIIPVHNIGD